MANARARRRKHPAKARRRRAQEAVIVRIAEIHLQRVVIHIAQGQFGLHPGQPERLELKPGHCSRRVLGQRLIDAQADLAAGGHVAASKVGANDFVRQIHLCLRTVPCFCNSFHHSPKSAASGSVTAFFTPRQIRAWRQKPFIMNDEMTSTQFPCPCRGIHSACSARCVPRCRAVRPPGSDCRQSPQGPS